MRQERQISQSCETELNSEHIREYVEGCQSLAFSLDRAVTKIIECGKRPTILIPSRGAVPIFLLMLETLQLADEAGIWANKNEIRYYPAQTFQLLSKERFGSHSKGSGSIDVILFPFTADVSSNTDNSEELALSLRQSCARAITALLFKSSEQNKADLGHIDFAWHCFLLRKIKPGLFQAEQKISEQFLPDNIIDAYWSLSKNDKRETVLIDTVISGRAAANIITAFADLGHPVTPLLAAYAGRKRDSKFEQQIREKMQRDYLIDVGSEYMVEFPLISEDKGAAMLGVAALNFTNFNNPNLFHQVEPSLFPQGYQPQSCIWIIPPEKRGYLSTFYEFMQRCRSEFVRDAYEREEWQKAKEFIKKVDRFHGELNIREIQDVTGLSDIVSAKETSSHIISVRLSQKKAESWIREFARAYARKLKF